MGNPVWKVAAYMPAKQIRKAALFLIATGTITIFLEVFITTLTANDESK